MHGQKNIKLLSIMTVDFPDFYSYAGWYLQLGHDHFLSHTFQLFINCSTRYSYFTISNMSYCRSQWPRGIKRRSLAARLLRLWVRIPPGAWIFVCCECCVLSGRGLCDGLIIRSEESYRMWRVVVCDQETS